MSEFESLLLIVGAIYLSECAWWIPRDAIVLRAWWGGAWHCRAANVMPGGGIGALCVLQPLPAVGSACVGAAWAVSLSEEGVLGFASQSLPPGPRVASLEARFFEWSALPQVSARDATVDVGGRAFARCASSAAAKELVSLLTRLQNAQPKARAALLDTEVARQFDLVALAAALGRAERATRELRWLQPALFGWLFVVVPFVWLRDELLLRWPILVAAFVALVAWIALRTWLAAKAMGLKAWKHALLNFVSPLAAMRARETLLRDVLARFHPLAAVKVLCDEREAARVLGDALRDAQHPFWPECPLEDERARRTEREWRERMRRAIAELAPEVARAAATRPVPEADSLAYCPRCLEQFLRIDRACARCGERPLVPF